MSDGDIESQVLFRLQSNDKLYVSESICQEARLSVEPGGVLREYKYWIVGNGAISGVKVNYIMIQPPAQKCAIPTIVIEGSDILSPLGGWIDSQDQSENLESKLYDLVLSTCENSSARSLECAENTWGLIKNNTVSIVQAKSEGDGLGLESIIIYDNKVIGER